LPDGAATWFACCERPAANSRSSNGGWAMAASARAAAQAAESWWSRGQRRDGNVGGIAFCFDGSPNWAEKRERPGTRGVVLVCAPAVEGREAVAGLFGKSSTSSAFSKEVHRAKENHLSARIVFDRLQNGAAYDGLLLPTAHRGENPPKRMPRSVPREAHGKLHIDVHGSSNLAPNVAVICAVRGSQRPVSRASKSTPRPSDVASLY
jgi:hypothetical protein